jgi:hypothetical protein
MPSRKSARDFVGEMEAFVRDECGGSEPYTATGMAQTLVEKLLVDDKALLRGWLDAQATDILRDYISTVDRSNRAHNRMMSKRVKFRDALRDHEAGDDEALTDWLATTFVVDEDQVRKPLGAMVRDELNYVADQYERTAASAAFEEAWFRAIAKKVGRGCVGDVFTEEELVKMRNSIDAVLGR